MLHFARKKEIHFGRQCPPLDHLSVPWQWVLTCPPVCPLGCADRGHRRLHPGVYMCPEFPGGVTWAEGSFVGVPPTPDPA